MQNEENELKIADLTPDQLLEELLVHPLTASIFMFLRQENRPLGVREVQRALQLSNPSTAYWHLNKLLTNNIVSQKPGNKYQIEESYLKIRKIPLYISLDFYLIRGKLVPNLFLILLFLGGTSFALFCAILFGFWTIAAFIGFFSLFIATGIILKSYLYLTHTSIKRYESSP